MVEAVGSFPCRGRQPRNATSAFLTKGYGTPIVDAVCEILQWKTVRVAQHQAATRTPPCLSRSTAVKLDEKLYNYIFYLILTA